MKKAKTPPADFSRPFSEQLETWLQGKQPKNLETLIEAFGERSFTVIIGLFMILPALPFPTEAHLFEALVILTAAQQVIGRKKLWFPKFLSKKANLQRVAQSDAMKKMLSRLKWLEHRSNPRFKAIFAAPLFDQVIGLIVIAFTLVAFFAPPFSLLDTLPAIAVVLISLSILLQDVVLLVVGLVVGALGAFLWAFFGAVITRYIKEHIFHKV